MVAMTPKDDLHRSMRRHMGAAMVILLLFLVVSVVWLGPPFAM
jgi:hypothetical protein